MEVEQLKKVSIEEYLTIERESSTKCEYYDGHIHAMAGGSFNHSRLCGNIFGELHARLKTQGRNCTAISSEMKLYIGSAMSFVYPDAMAVCGEIVQSELAPGSITNPTVIVEVLSKSTVEYDRGNKFFLYKQIPSLEEYILIEQDKPQIDCYRKKRQLLENRPPDRYGEHFNAGISLS